MARKNLILSIIYNLHISECKVFVLSANKYAGKGTDIVLFYKWLSPKVVRFLQSHNVQLFPFLDDSPFSEMGEKKDWHSALEIQKQYRYTYPMLLRNVLYHDFIKSRGSGYDKIIVADVKDVVFNSNPFIYSGNLNCYLESSTKSIGTENINRIWVQETYNNQVLDKLSKNPISCAGVITGTPAGLLNYYQTYCNELKEVAQAKENQLFDQAIHNFILETKEMPELKIIEDDTDLVSTLSYFKKRSKNEKKMPILHQYDRSKKLKLKYNKKYNNLVVYRTFAYRKLKHYYNLLRKKL